MVCETAQAIGRVAVLWALSFTIFVAKDKKIQKI
jgi:hypothetical protein